MQLTFVSNTGKLYKEVIILLEDFSVGPDPSIRVFKYTTHCVWNTWEFAHSLETLSKFYTIIDRRVGAIK